MGFPQIFEIIQRFKVECEMKGWKTSENEDWVKIHNKYHNFICTRTIHLSTFKTIAKAHKCALREGASYRVIDVSYSAWLFSEPLAEEIVHMVVEDPHIAERTALYDLSDVHLNKPICIKLNKTDSAVFQEFENFLQKRLDILFKSIQEASTKTV
jgi:hypothetical protein